MKFGKKKQYSVKGSGGWWGSEVHDCQVEGYKVLGLGDNYPAIVVYKSPKFHQNYRSIPKEQQGTPTGEQSEGWWCVAEISSGLKVTPPDNMRELCGVSVYDGYWMQRKTVVEAAVKYLDWVRGQNETR